MEIKKSGPGSPSDAPKKGGARQWAKRLQQAMTVVICAGKLAQFIEWLIENLQ